MGVQISISRSKINDNAKVLNNTSVKSSEDVRLELKDLEIGGQAEVLEKLEINTILQQLGQEARQMDKNSDEYIKIQDILKTSKWDKDKFIKCIIKHLSEFSQGVLASIVANSIMH